MKEISRETQERFLHEIAIRLNSAGVTVGTPKDNSLPIEYGGAYLCRVSGKGDVFYCESDVESEASSAALHRVIDMASEVSEYMRLMEKAPHLEATGLDGDYRILADFGNALLAGHPTKYGVQFITWEWSYDRTGVGQGHYHEQNYAGAKQDFAIRAGLIPQTMFFPTEQLDNLYRCCEKTRELDEALTFEDEQRIIKAQEHIETLAPGVQERVAALELQRQEQQSQTQTMY